MSYMLLDWICNGLNQLNETLIFVTIYTMIAIDYVKITRFTKLIVLAGHLSWKGYTWIKMLDS